MAYIQEMKFQKWLKGNLKKFLYYKLFIKEKYKLNGSLNKTFILWKFEQETRKLQA